MKQSTRCSERAIIRFGQVDGAGIVFYPRYFEMLARLFSSHSLLTGSCTIETSFLRPNRLGDEIELRLQIAADSCDWVFSGTFEGNEHFRMVGRANSPPFDTLKRGREPFHATRLQVGSWACDGSGTMSMSRYFELLSDAVERWFEAKLRLPFRDLHFARRLGIPTVNFKTVLNRLPGQLEDIELLVDVTAVGRTSMCLNHELRDRNRDQCLVHTQQTLVFVEFTDAGYGSVIIPEDVRAVALTLLQEKGS